jgi:rod shape-determining protein MreD
LDELTTDLRKLVMPRSVVIAVGCLLAIYVALVLQTSLVTGIAFTAAVAAWAVTSQPRSTGILWAALAGLACDAAGHDRLGLHLAAYAVCGALAAAIIPDALRRTGWAATMAAGIVAGGDRFASDLLASLLGRQTLAIPQTAGSALVEAALTAGVVLAVACVISLVRRVWQPASAGRPLQLANRWRMLTE